MYTVIYKYKDSDELYSLQTKSLRFIFDMQKDDDLIVLEYKKF